VVGAVLLMSRSLATWSLSSNRLAGAEDDRAADDREVAARVLLELGHALATPSRRIRSAVRISKDAGEEVEEARRRAGVGMGPMNALWFEIRMLDPACRGRLDVRAQRAADHLAAAAHRPEKTALILDRRGEPLLDLAELLDRCCAVANSGHVLTGPLWSRAWNAPRARSRSALTAASSSRSRLIRCVTSPCACHRGRPRPPGVHARRGRAAARHARPASASRSRRRSGALWRASRSH
jgi:hypothetical protein